MCLATMTTSAQVLWRAVPSANRIGPNEVLTVTFELQNGRSTLFSPPALADWKILRGPEKTMTQGNPKEGLAPTETFVYALQPKHASTCKIPSARVVVNGKIYSTNEMEVQVPEADNEASQGWLANNFRFDAYVLESGKDPYRQITDNLFLRCVVSKKECYEGEALEAEYRLYSRVNLDAQVVKRPVFNGFSTIDMDMGIGTSDYLLEQVNERIFRVYPLRKVQLTPIKSGPLAIDGMEVAANVSFIQNGNGQSDGTMENKSTPIQIPYQLISKPVIVQVKNLPPDSMTDVNPAVGSFQVKIEIDSSRLRKENYAEVDFLIEGNGQWNGVMAPTASIGQGATVEDALLEEWMDSSTVPVSGIRKYRYKVYSDKAGLYQLSLQGFRSFDPSTSTYKSLGDTSVLLLLPAPPSGQITHSEFYIRETGWYALLNKWRWSLAGAGGLILGLFLVFAFRRRQSRKNRSPLKSMVREIPYLDHSTRGQSVNEKEQIKSGKEFNPLLYDSANLEEAVKATRNQAMEYLRLDRPLPAGSDPQQLRQLVELCNHWLYAPEKPDLDMDSLREKWQKATGLNA